MICFEWVLVKCSIMKGFEKVIWKLEYSLFTHLILSPPAVPYRYPVAPAATVFVAVHST